jgi:hypothetical protein
MLALRLRLSTLPSWIFIDLNCSSDKTTSFDFFSIAADEASFWEGAEQENTTREKQNKFTFIKVFIVNVIVKIYLVEIRV